MRDGQVAHDHVPHPATDVDGVVRGPLEEACDEREVDGPADGTWLRGAKREQHREQLARHLGHLVVHPLEPLDCRDVALLERLGRQPELLADLHRQHESPPGAVDSRVGTSSDKDTAPSVCRVERR